MNLVVLNKLFQFEHDFEYWGAAFDGGIKLKLQTFAAIARLIYVLSLCLTI